MAIVALKLSGFSNYEESVQLFSSAILLSLLLSPVAIILGWRAHLGRVELAAVGAPLALTLFFFFALPQWVGAN